MQFSDLHIHSRYSDGLLWPEEIVSAAIQKGIDCISITDHDTIDSQYITKASREDNKLRIVPGVELSTEYEDSEIHILGYFIDVENSELNDVLNHIKESRIERAKAIISKLNALNIDISYEEIGLEGVSIGRPHIAKLLVSKGIASTPKEAFMQYLIKGRPAYVGRYKINYKDALRLIKKCNGISVLAHPGEIYKGISIERIIKEFRVYGLNGIEVFHPSHSSKQVADYYNLAKKYSLIISGGSDCHGIAYDNKLLIGSCGLDSNLTSKFLKVKNK